jgi:hypothetical protein
MMSYHYQPLDEENEEIRLVLLHPSENGARPKCSLSHYSLIHPPDYVALSYTWGDSGAAELIELDETTILVTANLKQALHSLREQVNFLQSNRHIWIDAICINQQDIAERNQQVPRMRRIFETAVEVIAWLGPETPESNTAIDFMNQTFGEMPDDGDKFKEALVEKEAWLGLWTDLLRRPWWTRIWVVQEAVVGRNLRLVCGLRTVTWRAFRKSIEFSIDNECTRRGYWKAVFQSKLKGTLSDFYHDVSIPLKVIGLRADRYDSKEMRYSIEDLVSRFRLSNSLLPADKNYALIGLATAETVRTLHLDYSLPYREIYTQFARAIIERTQRLDYICLARKPESEHGLPTWVPDLSVPRPIPFLRDMQIETLYSAAGNSYASFRFLHDDQTLMVDGFAVDEVKEIGNREFSWDKSSATISEILKHITSTLITQDSSSLEPRDSLSHALLTPSTDRNLDSEHRFDGSTVCGLFERFHGDSDLYTATFDGSLGPGEEWYNIHRQRLIQTLPSTFKYHCFVTSRKESNGVTPTECEPGDLICILFGCNMPIILRRRDGNFVFVGEWYVSRFLCERYLLTFSSYVKGIMNGEGIESWKRGEFERQEFALH